MPGLAVCGACVDGSTYHFKSAVKQILLEVDWLTKIIEFVVKLYSLWSIFTNDAAEKSIISNT